jgi:hypothetical protein
MEKARTTTSVSSAGPMMRILIYAIEEAQAPRRAIRNAERGTAALPRATSSGGAPKIASGWTTRTTPPMQIAAAAASKRVYGSLSRSAAAIAVRGTLS